MNNQLLLKNAPCVHLCVCLTHQWQKVEEQPRVLADEVVGLTAQVNKQLETTGGSLSSVDDVGHVWGQDERRSVPNGKYRREDLNGGLNEQRESLTLWMFINHRSVIQFVGKKGHYFYLLKLPNIWAWPRNLPKSMWNMWPVERSMMLSLWRSQMPRM